MAQMPGPTHFPAVRAAVTQRAVVGHHARTAHGVAYLSFPSDLPYRAGGTQSGSVLVALTVRKRLEVPIFQWDCREVSGGDGALDSAVLSRVLTPSSGLKSESVRSPLSPDHRRPARLSRSGATVDERRGRPSRRLCSASRAGRTGGRGAIAGTPSPAPLTWEAATEQELTRGRCAAHRSVRRTPDPPLGALFGVRHAIAPVPRRSYHLVEALARNRFDSRLPATRETPYA